MEILKTKKYAGIAGIGLLFISVFMPFIKMKKEYSSSTVKFDAFIQSWGGWLLLLMAVASAMIIFRKELEDKIPQLYKTGFGSKVSNWGEKGLYVPIGLSALVLFLVAIDCGIFYKLKVYTTYVKTKDFCTFGGGFWFAAIGLVLLIVYAIFYKGEEGAAQVQNNGMGGQPAWQPQQPMAQDPNMMNQNYGQPMQQDMNMGMNNGFQQPAQPMQQQPMQQDPNMMNQNFGQPMQQDPNMMNNQYPNNNNQF